ncbi:MAG: hypothetical protein KAH20_11305 [Methylococcales bacterium]|nr:hypothetical protein [Methylococcales bacterium]
MALIDDIKKILNTLAPHGWKELFEAHGLDITAVDLENELLQDISSSINRDFPGFDDFAEEGKQGVTPSIPSRSLVYHALSSQHVKWKDIGKTKKITKFPTLKQIETVENYVYAAKKTSLNVIEAIHGKANLAIVVFANQYRNAIDTPHKKHADLVYSRTGVARVGNAKMSYNKQTRSFDPLTKKKSELRVLPAKYNAYLAVKKKGSKELLGRGFNQSLDIPFSNTPLDQDLNFWSPVHKLFAGTECLEGFNLQVSFDSFQNNEKIRKIHKFVANEFDEDTGSTPSQHANFPFKFSEGIADFDQTKNLLIPIVHTAVVAKAEVNGQPSTLRKSFQLPLNRGGNSIAAFSSSMEFRAAEKRNPISQTPTGAQRSVPEYAHVRTQIVGGQEENINDLDDHVSYIIDESFEALHYLDFTGDGFISAVVNAPQLNSMTQVSAYSIVAPPDYFPYCEQSTIFDSMVDKNVWSRSPQTLADIRLLPNVKSHPQLLFLGIEAFDTCTALINGTVDMGIAQTNFKATFENRVTYLTDGAAGVFAPGWDTSFDMLQVGNVNVPHLAAYGLGSPFPEDAKLCAAISSFWPAVAPDIARSFWPDASFRETIIPLTDEEIGSVGGLGWDGEHGPIVTKVDGQEIVTYKKFSYVDYTLNALNNTFDYHKLANIDSVEYLARVEKYLLAKEQVRDNTILLSYTQEKTRQGVNHHYRFMLGFNEIQSSKDHVKLELLEDRNILVNSNNQVTIDR